MLYCCRQSYWARCLILSTFGGGRFQAEGAIWVAATLCSHTMGKMSDRRHALSSALLPSGFGVPLIHAFRAIYDVNKLRST